MKMDAVAIIGIGAIVPGARDFAEFWNNSLKTNCFIQEIPDEYWDKKLLYDPDPNAEDKSYSKSAGVVGNVEFDPMEFGLPPKTMQSICVEQIYGLAVSRQALIDAGLYGKEKKEFDRKRTGVIIAAPVGKNAYQLSARTNSVLFAEYMRNCGISEKTINEVIRNYKDSMPGWTEASNPGYLANVVSGRIANRFGFQGMSCGVDAACASSLAAVKLACQEILNGDCDLMIAGGVNLDLSDASFVSFCKTPAISRTDTIRPFDKNADGMVLGDGAGAVVLKKLSMAKRDGDKVYAVIEGFGSSSDGREASIFSPSSRGQILALERALVRAGVSADQIGYVEAHGTGTPVGDLCESRSIKALFDNSEKTAVTVGSCKGQIGHLRMAAGIAGLIHASLSVYHKVLLPTSGCAEINEELLNSSLYVSDCAVPWIVNNKRKERYASVSSFGFGGTNYSLLIKEYGSDHKEAYRYTFMPRGILLEAENRQQLIDTVINFRNIVSSGKADFRDPKFSYRKLDPNSVRLAFVAESAEEATEKAETAIQLLKQQQADKWLLNGIFYVEEADLKENEAAFMFSGQGKQHLNMFSDLACAYPELRESFTLADNEMIEAGEIPVSEVVYPKVFTEEKKKEKEGLLRRTDYAQMALAASEAGICKILIHRGVNVGQCIGHSFGELSALYAAGVYDEKKLMELTHNRGMCMNRCIEDTAATGMAAVRADVQSVRELISSYIGLYIANRNCPDQTVISGEIPILNQLIREHPEVTIKKLNTAGAFHSPYMHSAAEEFAEDLNKVKIHKPDRMVISNYTGKYYETEKEIRQTLPKQIESEVLFETGIRKMYENGCRCFIEIGPDHVLSSFVKKTLGDKQDYLVFPIDAKEKGLCQLESVIAYLAAWGMPVGGDVFEKKLSDETIVRKTSRTYSVPPTFFVLPEEMLKMAEAKSRKVSPEVPVTEKTEKDMFIYLEKKIKEREKEQEMNKYEAMCEIQKINASVIEEYVSFQKEYLEQIKKVLNTNSLETESGKKIFFDYMGKHHENDLNVFTSYFRGSEKINTSEIESDDNSGSNTEKTKTRNCQAFSIQNAGGVEKEIQSWDKINAIPEVSRFDEEFSVKKEFSEAQEQSYGDSNMADKADESVPVAMQESKTGMSSGEIIPLLLDIVSEITGYPKDMLEENMELEADLGIDSIRRIDLFSQMNEKLGNIFGQDDMSQLGSVHTIKETADLIVKIINDPDHRAATDEEISKLKAITG